MARLAILVILFAGGFAYADQPAVDDSRLGGCEIAVRAVVDRAGANGLPTEILVDKVREGLAKKVPPARIALVVRDLADSLGRARSETQNAGVVAPSAALLKTIVDAHAAGVGTAEVAAVLRSGVQDCERALQVLTDLAQRGYPVSVAARTVAAISARGKNALVNIKPNIAISFEEFDEQSAHTQCPASIIHDRMVWTNAVLDESIEGATGARKAAGL